MLLRPVLELAGHTAADDRQRLGTYLLGKQEVLEKAQTVGLPVVREETVLLVEHPPVHIDRTVLHRIYRILPLVPVLKRRTFDYAPSGETEYAGLEIRDGLCDILPQAVLVTVVSVHREKRDMLQVDAARLLRVALLVPRLQVQPEARLFHGLFRGENQTVFLPFT